MLYKKMIYEDVDVEKIKEIRSILEKWCEGKSYETFQVIVVLYELYNNAMKYSNDGVDITIKLYSQSIVIRINDQGDGFNVKEKLKISTFDIKENMLKPCGRGIYIVKKFVTDIYYNQKGNNVVVKIKENK